MATIGQITSEFIVRGEGYFYRNFPKILEDILGGGTHYDDDLLKLYDLYQFLVELQGLYHTWTDKEILVMIDYFDAEFNLKAIQASIPDPYKVYANTSAIVRITNVMDVPPGNGLLEQKDGKIVLYPNDTEINNYYGLD